MNRIPVTSLDPSEQPPEESCFRAVVTLSWPYSSSTRQCALLLADPDFRLRFRRGQVRVRFTGRSAEAVAQAHIGIGDEVELDLSGAAWEEDREAGRTPGRGVGGELRYGHKLVLRVIQSGAISRIVEVDAAASPVPTNMAVSMNDSGVAVHSTPDVTPLSSWEPRPQNIHSRESTFDSPAFIKRSKLPGDDFLESAYDPFTEPCDDEEQRPVKKQCISFAAGMRWRYTEATPSPTKSSFEHRPESPSRRQAATELSESPKVQSPVTPSSQPVSQAMLPSSLLHLRMLSEHQVELTHNKSEQQTTSKLQPIESATLSLPSPFPMEVAAPISDVSISTSPSKKSPLLDTPDTFMRVPGENHEDKEQPFPQNTAKDDLRAVQNLPIIEDAMIVDPEHVTVHRANIEKPEDYAQRRTSTQSAELGSVAQTSAYDTNREKSVDDADAFQQPENVAAGASAVDVRRSKEPELDVPPNEESMAALASQADAALSTRVVEKKRKSDRDQVMAQTYRNLFGFQVSQQDDEGTVTRGQHSHAASQPHFDSNERQNSHNGLTDGAFAMPSFRSDQADAIVEDQVSPAAEQGLEVQEDEPVTAIVGLSSPVDEREPSAMEHEPTDGVFADMVSPVKEMQPRAQDIELAGTEIVDLLSPVIAQVPSVQEDGPALAVGRASQDLEQQSVEIIELDSDAESQDQSVSHGDNSEKMDQNAESIENIPFSDTLTIDKATAADLLSRSQQRAEDDLLRSTLEVIPNRAAHEQPFHPALSEPILLENDVNRTADLLDPSPAPVGYPIVVEPGLTGVSDKFTNFTYPTDYQEGNVHLNMTDLSTVDQEQPVLLDHLHSTEVILTEGLSNTEVDITSTATIKYPLLPLSPFDSEVFQSAPSQTISVPLDAGRNMPSTPEPTQEESAVMPSEGLAAVTSVPQPTENFPQDSEAPPEQTSGVIDSRSVVTQTPASTAATVVRQDVHELAQQSTPLRRSSRLSRSHTPDAIPDRTSRRRSISHLPLNEQAIEEESGADIEPLVESKAIHETALASVTESESATETEAETRLRVSNGLSTSLSYFTPLSRLAELRNAPSQQAQKVDILAVVTQPSNKAARAKTGPRDFFTILNISDTSLPGQSDIRVEVFRPWMATLPVSETGDVILLRAFAVKSRKRAPYLLSTDESAWCVWRFPDQSEAAQNGEKPVWTRRTRSKGSAGVREEMKGPPVELGEEERQYAWRLRDWWLASKGKA